MRLTKTALAAALAINAAELSGAVSSSYCPEPGVCFRWGVPPAAAGSGSRNFYYQLRVSASYAWAGLGIGSQMRGADMFLIYADGNNNVTLSTRRGTGYTMPLHVQRPDVQLLEGSGISDGQMTANIRCSGCDNLDASGSTGWIAAWSAGVPLNSQNPSEPITIHDAYDVFSVNLARASMSSDQNPFLAPEGAAGAGGDAVTGTNGNPGRTLANAHGILMTIVFVVGYPIGSLLMPLVGKWLLHASWQIVTFISMWAAFGIGYVIARRADAFFMGPHTQLGVLVCALLGLQPVLGWLHHMHYVKHQRRGIVSYIHIWYGRVLMVLGIINGGLGLSLSGSPRRFVTAYCIMTAVVTFLYLLVIFFGLFRNARRRNKRARPVMSDDAIKLTTRENLDMS